MAGSGEVRKVFRMRRWWWWLFGKSNRFDLDGSVCFPRPPVGVSIGLPVSSVSLLPCVASALEKSKQTA